MAVFEMLAGSVSFRADRYREREVVVSFPEFQNLLAQAADAARFDPDHCLDIVYDLKWDLEEALDHGLSGVYLDVFAYGIYDVAIAG